MRILVTSGGTEEPLDGVRRVTNLSTGRTGTVLAREFAAAGNEVLLLHGERADLSALGDEPIRKESYLSFTDLERLLRDHLDKEYWSAVVHLAAVSDYKVDEITVDGRAFPPGGPGKIGTGKEVIVTLRPNPKLLDSLKLWSRNPEISVVGFKLTDDPDVDDQKAQVAKLFDRGGTDLVVHNELRDITPEEHPAAIWRGGNIVARTRTKMELAEALLGLLQGENI